MLSSKHKASDVLSAEFIRTFRHDFFYGNEILQRYEALQNTAATMTTSVLVPKCKGATAATDFSSLYGFRPRHPDVFYLSSWEFTQWFTKIPLHLPYTGNRLSKWTATGLRKRKANIPDADVVPGEDFVFDDAQVTVKAGFFRFPQPCAIFKKSPPEQYVKFQKRWCLQRRLQPVVPCPEHTPLPRYRNNEASKESRSRILSVYLRPWTLCEALATAEVPFLPNIAERSSPHPSNEARNITRPKWKRYLQGVLPHAEKGIRSFLLTTLAEGRGHDEEEAKETKGPEVTCSLTVPDVHNVLRLQPWKHDADDITPTAKLVSAAAEQANVLSKMAGNCTVDKTCSDRTHCQGACMG